MCSTGNVQPASCASRLANFALVARWHDLRSAVHRARRRMRSPPFLVARVNRMTRHGILLSAICIFVPAIAEWVG
jgi:hypothetical protein